MNHLSNQNSNKEKSSNIVRRLRLKRQTKLLCTIDEKWNNCESLNKLINYGVDGVEIHSEIQSEIKKEMIQKIRSISKETKQHLPILYNLSYFRTLVKSIYSLDKSDPTDNTLLEHKDINLSENQAIYIFKEKKEIEDFLVKNLHYLNKDLSEADHNESNKVSTTSLPPFAYNLVINPNEAKNIYYNLSGVEDGVKEFKNFKEKLDNELIVNVKEDNASLNNDNPNVNNVNVQHQINAENVDQEAQELIENADIANIINNFEALRSKNFLILSTDPPLNFKNFEVADLIHINFGEVTFTVSEIGENFIKCKCLNSGKVKVRNSFSIEGKDHFVSNLILTEERKLYEALLDAVDLKVDYIVISVISEPNKEIEQIKKVLKENNSKIKIMVKIDNPNSINYFDNYVENVDAIYFSRNDLNIKDCLSKICYNQKTIISKCCYLGIPIIISGTFLDTMRFIPNPIRAEISDLYNTILLGIDCLLLTSEIVEGMYPFEAIETINEICSCCEKRVDYSNLFLEVLYKTKKPMKIVEAVASSTVKTSFNLQTPYIVCLTEKGTAAICLSKYRPFCPVISFTSKEDTAISLSIFRGLFTIIFSEISNIDAVITYANEFLLKNKLIPPNTNIVLLSGINETKNGTTDQMRVINVSDHQN